MVEDLPFLARWGAVIGAAATIAFLYFGASPTTARTTPASPEATSNGMPMRPVRGLMGALAVGTAVFFGAAWARSRRRHPSVEARELGVEAAALADALRGLDDSVILLDLAGTVLWVNPAFCRSTGYSAEEAIGRNASTLEGGAHLSRLSADLASVVRRGLPWRGDVLGRRKEGHTYPAELVLIPILGSADCPPRVVAILRNITARVATEQRLHASETSFRALIENAPDGIVVTRAQRIVYANSAAAALLHGPDTADFEGLELGALIHPDDRAAHQAQLAAALASEPTRPVQLRLLRRDGEPASVETVALRIVFDGLPSVASLMRDITERKNLQATLLLADRMTSMGMLAAGIAHEINNPLTYVLANLSMAAGSVEDLRETPENLRTLTELREALADAIVGAERVRDIVRDLKIFSRDPEPSRGPVKLETVSDSAIRMAWNEIRHRARLVKDFGQTPPVAVTEGRLAQVILNLLVNAAQAIPAGRASEHEIRVTTATSGSGRATLEVRDTGPGMAPEVLSHVFEPFFTTKPVGVGTGLGLAICKRIVGEAGGEITVESAPGKGSAFRIALPAAETATPPSVPDRAASPLHRRGRVLVVDDELLVGVVVARVLRAEHEVEVLTSPRQALSRLLRGEEFDVILTDLMMPDMGGMAFFAELSAQKPAMAERTLFMSGGALSADAAEFAAAMAERLLPKPLDAERLRAVVGAAVRAANKENG